MFGLFVGVRANTQNAAVQGVALIRVPDGTATIWFYLSTGQHPISFIADFQHCACPLLHRTEPRCLCAGYRLAGGMVDGGDDFFVIGFVLFNIARRLLSRMQLKD